MHWLTAPFVLIYRVILRFGRERYSQTAAALSFATLLGLVPMLAIGAVLIEKLPFGIRLGAALEDFILRTLLPEKAGAVIAKYLGQFAHQAEQVTWIGLSLLVLTALTQMLTIEHAFNVIWQVKRRRPWFKRLGLHVLALVAGPLVFSAALASITFLASASFGLVSDASGLRTVFFQLLSPVFLALLFGMLYWGLPNRTVSMWHAGISGLLAAGALIGMQRLFALYVVKFPTYTLIYGAFSAMPIFLLWLYLSWSVILLGALLTAEIPNLRR
jgi:membrane protein